MWHPFLPFYVVTGTIHHWELVLVLFLWSYSGLCHWAEYLALIYVIIMGKHDLFFQEKILKWKNKRQYANVSKDTTKPTVSNNITMFSSTIEFNLFLKNEMISYNNLQVCGIIPYKYKILRSLCKSNLHTVKYHPGNLLNCQQNSMTNTVVGAASLLTVNTASDGKIWLKGRHTSSFNELNFITIN